MNYIREIIFSKAHFSVREAKNWLKYNKYKPIKLEYYPLYYLFVLYSDQNEYNISTYDEVEPGVNFIIVTY